MKVSSAAPIHQATDTVPRLDFIALLERWMRLDMPKGVLPLAIGEDQTAVGAAVLHVDHFTSHRGIDHRPNVGSNVDAGVEVSLVVQPPPAKIGSENRIFIGRDQRQFSAPRLLIEVLWHRRGSLPRVEGGIGVHRLLAPLKLHGQRRRNGLAVPGHEILETGCRLDQTVRSKGINRAAA